MVLNDWVDRFAVWDGFHPDLQMLLRYGVGIALYTALVFAFYQNISVRDPLHSKPRKGWIGRVIHYGETALTFPVLSFGYFVVLSLALFLLSKATTSTANILLLSMAAVLGVRVAAHVSESMANDLAKLLPLSLLAVVLVDVSYLSGQTIVSRVAEAAAMIPVLVQYFVLFILVEAALRGIRALVPGLSKLTHRIEHKRGLSKRAMLRDVADEHGGHHLHLLKRNDFHEHGPRDRSRDFLALDEHSGGKPGTKQGVGPAIKPELARAHGHEHVAKPSKTAAPKAGPGGSGGKLGSW